MTLEDLKAFIKAYESKNFSAAARQLNCTQAAVAQHVKRLEKELSSELFTRAPRGVLPTVAGTILYKGASSALSALQTSLQEVENNQYQRNQQFRFAVSSAAAVSPMLRPAILMFHQEYPNIQLDIIPENTVSGRINALQQGRADLALTPETDLNTGLETRPAMEIVLELLVNRKHKFASRKRLKPSELNNIPYIAQAERSATFLHIQQAIDPSISLRPQLIVEDPLTAALMVELNKGVTFVPEAIARQIEATGLVVGIKLPWLKPMSIVWIARNFASLPDAAKIFLDVYENSAQH